MEKTSLNEPLLGQSQTKTTSKSGRYLKTALAIAIPITYLTFTHSDCLSHLQRHTTPISLAKDDSACYQPPPVTPVNPILEQVELVYKSDDFVDRAAELLGKAVRINTELFDGWADVGKTPEWEKFYAFHGYLNKSFPLVHKHLELTHVNTFGLIYTWQGTNTTLKPLMLTGHQDTVPVERTTIGDWKESPWSGKYDGTYIWGRGSCDDKSGLVGIMTAIETLLEEGFTPRRTVVVGSGFDEEGSGPRGAGNLAGVIEDKYGKDGIAMIVDEGNGFGEEFGVLMATPATGEKGQGNIQIDVETLGGHSSKPPDHTAIGYLAMLIAKIESQLHAPNLTRENPYFTQLTCGAKYGSTIPKDTRSLIEHALTDDKALKELGLELGKSRATRGMVSTTQAVDLISGGLKVNALPERVTTTINHRINVASSYQELEAYLIDLLTPVIEQYNLQLQAFGNHYSTNTSSPAAGLVKMEHWAVRKPLNPAPVSPSGKGEEPWELLAGVIKSSYGTRRDAKEGESEILVSPGLMGGNTDTKYYWDLTRSIFRYGHTNPADMYTPTGVHSVNEALKATGFVEIIRFLARLIVAADESDNL